MTDRFRLVLLAHLAFLLAAGCPEDGEWVPRGELRIVAVDESVDGDGVKRALLTWIVSNTGSSSIALARAATRLVTDRETYYLQLDWEGNLPAGKSVYSSMFVSYRSIEEGASRDDVFIDSAFFR